MRSSLIQERLNKKLTRKQVAEVLGISEVYVRKIEEGSRNPGRETMLKFEKFYKKPAEELFPDLFHVHLDTKRIKELEKEVI